MVTGKDTKPSAAPKEFQAKPFAFFKLAYDGVRTGMQQALSELEQLSQEYNEPGADLFKTRFAELVAAVDALNELEVRGLFPLIDSTFDDISKSSKFPEEILECRDLLSQTETELEKVLADPKGGLAGLNKAASTWVTAYEASLKKKEEVLTPLYAKISPDLYGRAKAVNDILKSFGGLDAVQDVLIGYVIKQLVHVKRSYGHARMFCSAIQTVLSSEEFGTVKTSMEKAAGLDTWTQLLKDGMKKGGKLIDPNAPSSGMEQAKDLARKSLKKSKSLLLKARKSFTLHAAMVNTKSEQDEFDVLEAKAKS